MPPTDRTAADVLEISNNQTTSLRDDGDDDNDDDNHDDIESDILRYTLLSYYPSFALTQTSQDVGSRAADEQLEIRKDSGTLNPNQPRDEHLLTNFTEGTIAPLTTTSEPDPLPTV